MERFAAIEYDDFIVHFGLKETLLESFRYSNATTKVTHYFCFAVLTSPSLTYVVFSLDLYSPYTVWFRLKVPLQLTLSLNPGLTNMVSGF